MTDHIASAFLSVSASAPAYPLVVPLRYLGSDPSASTKNLATKQFSDTYFQQNALVTRGWVDDQVDSARSNILLQSAVNSQLSTQNPNSGYLTVAQLKTTLSAYAESSRLGASQGLAKANASGVISAADNPNFIPSGISTDNVVRFHNCLSDTGSTVWLTTSQTVIQSVPTAYIAASFTIPDPGFPYYPMNFVYIRGMSSGSSDVRTQNSNPINTGRILVAPSSASLTSLPTNWFALGECTASPYINWYTAIPYVNSWTNTSLPVRPYSGTTALRGDLTLNLYLSNASGNGYTFYGGSGFTWFIMVIPTGTMTLASTS